MRTEYSIKNSITSIISNIISFIFLFIGKTFLIKILGIEYNGLNGLFSNVLTILNVLELGISNAITFNLYKYIAKDDKKTINLIMKYYKKAYQVIALMIFFVGLLLIPFLKFFIKDVSIDINISIVYLLFLLCTVSTYLVSYKRSLLFANQRNYVINIIHVFYLIVLNVSQILIICLTKNYYLYLIVKIICVILENIIINIKVNKDYSFVLNDYKLVLKKNIRNDIKNRVKALFIHKTSAAITNGTDNIIISSFFGLKLVGLYTNYNYIIYTITVLFSDFIKSTSASVGNLLTEKDFEKKYLIFKKIRFLNFWISTFTAVCLLILIEPFITIWIGKKYLLETSVLFVLIINYFQTMMKSTYNIFKDSAGIWIEDRYVPIIQIIINISLSILFLKLFGLVGVFIGTIISSLVLWLYSYPKFVYKKLFNKDYLSYYISIIKYILLFCFITLISYVLCDMISMKSSILQLLFNFIIGILVPNVILYLFYRKTDEFKYYLDLIKKILFRKRSN